MRMKGRSVFGYDVYAPTTITTMLRPRHQASQSILHEVYQIAPAIPFEEYTDLYGNSCQRATLPPGQYTITTEVEAEVAPSKTAPEPSPPFALVGELPVDTMHYILPSRYCQSDLYEINMLALEIAGNLKPGYEQVEAIRKWIFENIRYQYGVTDASTTASDVARSRVGVCRDFTHLAIALCRNLCIPTRMTVGYLDKLTEIDLHAWFEVYMAGEWYTFDAVQEKTEGYRIEIAHGRDAADVAMVTQYGNAILQSLTVAVALLDHPSSED